jgi:hypothetical protein
MNLAMVTAAQGHREFIAHLAAERWALRETHLVRVRWLVAADQARLFGDEPDVIEVAQSAKLGQRQNALDDPLAR